MRLWSLHPKYLDARGLVALWREGLLAQAVLHGDTRGYTRHPQLVRFRRAASPAACIGCYLREVHAEATRRGYRFDRSLIRHVRAVRTVDVTAGQIAHEWSHLRRKLSVRDRVWLAGFRGLSQPDVHPLFRVVPGPVEDWERGARIRQR